MESLVYNCGSSLLCYDDQWCIGAGTGLTNTSPYKVYHITKFYEPSNLNVALPTPAIGYVSYTIKTCCVIVVISAGGLW